MNRPDHSLPPEYFDRKYAEKLDYWDFETSPYEAEKYASSLAALPRERYRRGFEIGCSIGVLTAKLAARCDALLSIDVADAALNVARQRCAQLPQVRLQRMQFPGEQPGTDERLDLIVVSEVGYYWSREELAVAKDWMVANLSPGGTLLLVHYTPPVSDYPLTGDEVHEAFLTDARFQHRAGDRKEQYRLDVLIRAEEQSAPARV